MTPSVLRVFGIVLLALWWGGLTFYAAVVVPVGTDVVGVTVQGFITQRVTGWLNLLGLAALVPLGWLARLQRDRRAAILWGILAVSLAALICLHPQLDRLLDAATHQVLDHDAFYGWHRGYLLLTALQWLAGLALLARLSKNPPLTPPSP